MMRAMAIVVPLNVDGDFPTEVGQAEGDEDAAGMLILEGSDEPLDDGNAPMVTDRAIADFHVSALAPFLEAAAKELRTFVRDHMARLGSRDVNGSSEESADFHGCRFLEEHGKTHALAGEVVHDQGDPMAERPDLRKSERKPGCPEAGGGWHGGQVHMPDMVGVLGRDDAGRGRLFFPRFGLGRWRGRFGLEHAPDGCGRQTEAGAGKQVGDSFLAHDRTEDLEALDNVADELGELVDGFGQLDQGRVAILVRALEPGSDGFRFQEESLGGLGEIPCAGGFEFKR